MWCSRVLWVLALVPGLLWAEDEAVDAILERSLEIVEQADEQAGETARDLQADDTVTIKNSSWLKGSRVAGGDLDEKTPGKTAQQRAWNEIAANVEGLENAQQDGTPHPKVPDDVLYVYISMSMPEETLRSLFLQALHAKTTRSTIFVLRGWQPPNLNKLVSKLNKVFPDAQKLNQLPNVQINPNLFDQQAVERVPMYSTKDRDGRWGTVLGVTSIDDAIKRVERGRYDGEVIGPTYEIEEPNILALIKERIAKVDWNAQVEQAKATVLTKRTAGRDLPVADKSESYLVDLSIVNNRDLRGTRGEVFASAGMTINPFDYMTTQRRYVFFDANDDEQLAQAVRWREKYAYTTMISTVPPTSKERRTFVIEQLRQPVYEINEMLISRFKLSAVPSVAYQEGKMLRVDVVGMSGVDTAIAEARTGHE